MKSLKSVSAFLTVGLAMFLSPLVAASVQSESAADKLNYIAIHLEVGCDRSPWHQSISKTATVTNLDYQAALWPSLIELIALADSFDFKLTLYLNPQWGELIGKDKKKTTRFRGWIKNGHELAFHHHGPKHEDWNGFSDLISAQDRRDYRGSAAEGFAHVEDLVKGYRVTTGTITDWESDTKEPIDTFTWGGPKDGDRFGDSLSQVRKIYFEGKGFWILRHGLLDTVWGDDKDFSRTSWFVDRFIEMHGKRTPGEVFGVVTHLHDFHRRPQSLKTLFEHLASQKETVVTVKTIIEGQDQPALDKPRKRLRRR